MSISIALYLAVGTCYWKPLLKGVHDSCIYSPSFEDDSYNFRHLNLFIVNNALHTNYIIKPSPFWIPNRKRPDCWGWLGWLMLPLTAVWNNVPGCWTGEEVVVWRFATPFCEANMCDCASSWAASPPCSELMLDWGIKRPTGGSCWLFELLPSCIGCCSWYMTCWRGSVGFPKAMGSDRSCWFTVTILAWEKSREVLGVSCGTRLLLVSGGIWPWLPNMRLEVGSVVGRGLLQNSRPCCCCGCWLGERVFADGCGEMFWNRGPCWPGWGWSWGWGGCCCCCSIGLLCWMGESWVWAWNTDRGSGVGVCRLLRKASCCCCCEELLDVSCDGRDVWGRKSPGVEGCWSGDCSTVIVFWNRAAWTCSWDAFWNKLCGSRVSDKDVGLWKMGGEGCEGVCWR